MPSPKYWSASGMRVHDFAGFEANLAQRRTAIQAGAFVEETVVVFEAFGEGAAIVRVHVDDLVGVLDRDPRRRRAQTRDCRRRRREESGRYE